MGRSRTFARCQAIASPSRSSSDANHTVFAVRAKRLSSSTTLRLSSGISYIGSNDLSISTPSPFFAKSRMWPKLDFTVYSLPKNRSMVLALAGDSTITKFSIKISFFLLNGKT